MSSFGKNVKLARKKQGISQKELGERVGVAQTTIASYENDSRFPNAEILVGLAKELRSSIDHLMNFSSNGVEDLDIRKIKKMREKFLTYVFNHDKENAVELIKSLNLNEETSLIIYDEILVYSLHEIRQLWNMNEIDIHQKNVHYKFVFEAMRLITSDSRNETRPGLISLLINNVSDLKNAF